MDKKVALITGGSKGIGASISIELANLGFDVVINYNTDITGAEETLSQCKSLGVDGFVIKGDVSKEADVNEIFNQLMEKYGKLDVLVNNAGITDDGLLIRMSEEQFSKVVDTNLISTFLCMREAGKIMAKKRSGKIINISSIVGLHGNAGQVNYSASKAGVIGMTKSIARELAGRNILVNVVAPGFVKTSMTDKLSDKVKDGMLDAIPLKRFASASDIANVVGFLASEKANYITGQVISVDGGMNI